MWLRYPERFACDFHHNHKRSSDEAVRSLQMMGRGDGRPVATSITELIICRQKSPAKQATVQAARQSSTWIPYGWAGMQLTVHTQLPGSSQKHPWLAHMASWDPQYYLVSYVLMFQTNLFTSEGNTFYILNHLWRHLPRAHSDAIY